MRTAVSPPFGIDDMNAAQPPWPAGLHLRETGARAPKPTATTVCGSETTDPLGHKSIPSYSGDSLSFVDAYHGRMTFSSTDAGWRSLLVQERLYPTDGREFVTAITDDLTIVVLLDDFTALEANRAGTWRTVLAAPGASMTIPAKRSERLRWRSSNSLGIHAVHIHLPVAFLDAVLLSERVVAMDDHGQSDDPVVLGVTRGLVAAMRSGSSEEYPLSAARLLAAHLAFIHSSKTEPSRTGASPGSLDKRIERALRYMESNLEQPLTVGHLAREACLSPYHFVRVFSAILGRPPMRHLADLRMQRARSLLITTSTSVGQVARRCGYGSQSAFAAAVSRFWGRSPRELRDEATTL